MKYYEFTDPYYALIKAENQEEAVSIYTEEVVGESEVEEIYIPVLIDSNTALGKYFKCIEETDGEKLISDLMNDFKNPNNYILLIDGELL